MQLVLFINVGCCCGEEGSGRYFVVHLCTVRSQKTRTLLNPSQKYLKIKNSFIIYL